LKHVGLGNFLYKFC